MGNATEFGWFPLLAAPTPQLIVSQTVPRSGRHWVVSLSPRFQILFDSREFGFDSEDFQVVDLDHDGTYEISLRHQAFWGFHGLTMAESPLPEIIFRYDAKVGKYLPANPRFQLHLLSDLARTKLELISHPGELSLPSSLGVLLTYLFAGKEQEGWDFFEQAYKQPDRPQVKAKIKARLRKDPVWIFLSHQKNSFPQPN